MKNSRGDRKAVQVERSERGAYQGGRPRHVGSWATAGTVLSACTRTRVRALDDLNAWLKLYNEERRSRRPRFIRLLSSAPANS